jgi:hypothetical protein
MAYTTDELLEERVRFLTAQYAALKQETQSLKKLILQLEGRLKKAEIGLSKFKK